ncbi:MAG: type II toxin-antitoxin system Phd/YefM family antitoxin [Methylobacter sp.]|nr:MAG: type II toxin-antitoxin system Phd/YefM family antitoxin [Methylobacter sp.]
MKTVASTEAKSNFGALLDSAQRGPVTIEKKGRPVAVIISYEDYQQHEILKLESLRNDLMAGIRQADKGKLIDGEQAFHDLI